MPHTKRDVFSTGCDRDKSITHKGYCAIDEIGVCSCGAAKPTAPPNLWEAMDKLAAEYRDPVGCFTTGEYMNRYNVNKDRAKFELAALVKKGAVAKIRRGVWRML